MTTGRRWILAAAILGSAIVFLDSTIVNVALPAIRRELPATLVAPLEGASYVFNAYLLSLSALLILAGALSDSYGTRRMFAIGLSGFGVMSALCGLAPNLELLIAFRVLQGACGAILVPGSLAILTQTFEGEERGRVFGVWAGASAATTLFGPFVGGLLVDLVSWRLAFLINVPLVALALYATLKHLPEHRRRDARGRFDWLGAIVVALAVGGLSFGAIRGQEHNWQDPLAFAALGVGAIAAVGFPILMARSAHPLVPLGLFRSRNFSVTNLSTLLIYGALYVYSYFYSLFIQGTIGYTASASGLSGVPSSLFLIFLSSRFGSLSARYGPRIFMTVGPAIMAAGVLWFARFPDTSLPWLFTPSRPETLLPSSGYLVDVLPGLLLFGFGLSIMVAPLTTALMSSVPVANSGLASAINNAISRVGPQLALAAIFVAITATFYVGVAAIVPGLDPSSTELRGRISPFQPPPPGTDAALAAAAHRASTESVHLAMLVAAALLAAGAAVNWVGIVNSVAHGCLCGTPRGRGVLGRLTVTARDWDARTYDRIANPMAAWGTAVLDRLQLTGDERVLDAGCGSGRVTERLLERLPRGSVVAVDGSPRMIDEARVRLAAYDGRVEYVVADLARPLAIAPVDAILSTATFHWILDHDALFANLAAVLRRNGQLVAQCGGGRNLASVMRILDELDPDRRLFRPWHFAWPEETERRLANAGFPDVQVWLHDEPTDLPPETLPDYLRTIILGSTLERMPKAEREPLVQAVAARIPNGHLDYVRLNITARRG